MSSEGLAAAVAKMEDAGVGHAAIAAFRRFYGMVEAGSNTHIREDDISGLTELPHLDLHQTPTADDLAALDRVAVIKLNGGLGTSMGMREAKSLLHVRRGPVPLGNRFLAVPNLSKGRGFETGLRPSLTDGSPDSSHPVTGSLSIVHEGARTEEEMLTFLDIIAGQIQATRAATGARLPVMFMNSFRTQDDTRAALHRYPELIVADDLPHDFLQNMEPKLLASNLQPVTWPDDPELEWCPPGHGDLYPALFDAGIISSLLSHGYRYAFVSNADNLGATPDPLVAGWFAASGAPYAAEMCRKTEADIKGGQLVIRNWDQQLIQRETAQTHHEDIADALDAAKHPYFHTNNLWFDLEALQNALSQTGGFLELPLIMNHKTVDPTDHNSPAVIQIESAMGAAVAVFPGAQAVEVSRSRFLPVKTTEDLLVVRSDVFELTDDYRLVATAQAPIVKLSSHYRHIEDFEERFPYGPPYLRGASSLTVEGDWVFGGEITVTGNGYLPPGTGHVPDQTIITAAGI